MLRLHRNKQHAIPLESREAFVNERTLPEDFEMMLNDAPISMQTLSDEEHRIMTLLKMEHALCYHMNQKVTEKITDQVEVICNDGVGFLIYILHHICIDHICITTNSQVKLSLGLLTLDQELVDLEYVFYY